MRLKKDYKQIIKRIFQFTPKKFVYNDHNRTITLYFSKPSLRVLKRWPGKNFIKTYLNELKEDVTSGPDTWLSGDIVYIDKNEIDEKEYLINIKVLKTEFK